MKTEINSILESFEYIRQISSKSLIIILSYTVSKLGLETWCTYTYKCNMHEAEILKLFQIFR